MAISLTLILPRLSHSSGFMGDPNNPDPDWVICIFPDGNNRPSSFSLNFIFNHPFFISHHQQLLPSPSSEYYYTNTMETADGNHQFTLYTSLSTPVCLSLNQRLSRSDQNVNNQLEIKGMNAPVMPKGQKFKILSFNATSAALYQPEQTIKKTVLKKTHKREQLSMEHSHSIDKRGKISTGRLLLLSYLTSHFSRILGVNHKLFHFFCFDQGMANAAIGLLLQLLDINSSTLFKIATADNPELSFDQELEKQPILQNINKQQLATWSFIRDVLVDMPVLRRNYLLDILTLPVEQQADQLGRFLDLEQPSITDEESDEILALSLLNLNTWDFVNAQTGHKFKKEKELGRGAEGTVWLVTNEKQKQFALKQITILGGQQTISLGRLITLLQQNKLNSKRVIQLREHWCDGKNIYQVMDYKPGGDLHHLIKTTPGPSPQKLKYYAFQLVDVIARLHLSGITHRDIKPLNILVEGDHIFLADLGTIREIESSDQMVESQVRTVMYMGATTADAIASLKSYSPLKADYEELANSLIWIYLQKGVFDRVLTKAKTVSQQAQWLSIMFKNMGITKKTPNKIIKEKLKTWIDYKDEGFSQKIPEDLFDFIVELLQRQPQNIAFDTLTSLMKKNLFFKEFLDESESVKFKSNQQKQAYYSNQIDDLQARLGSEMTIQYVDPDGDCLPNAIAQAFSQLSRKRVTAAEIRSSLELLLRQILEFIDNITRQPSLNVQEALQLQALLYQELETLTGINAERLRQQINNHDISRLAHQTRTNNRVSDGWLEPEFIPLIQQILAVNIRQMLPAHSEQQRMMTQQYDSHYLAQTIPVLSFYLQQVNLISLAPYHETITIIHNGERGGGGHYYYATPTIRDCPSAQRQQPCPADQREEAF